MMVQHVPFRLLDFPTELIIRIFLDSQNSDLILVCRTICDIIRSTPEFWTTIYINESHFHDRIGKITQSSDTTFLAFLGRSGAFPLNVTIRAVESQHLNPYFASILWLDLSPQKHRIESLIIHAGTVSLINRILYAVLAQRHNFDTIPSLRTVDIRWWHRDPETDSDPDGSYRPVPSGEDCIIETYGSFIDYHKPLISFLCFPAILPVLTTLYVSLFSPYFPSLHADLPSLETLVLDGSTNLGASIAYTIVARFLFHTPNLKTFWCKDSSVYAYQYRRNRIQLSSFDSSKASFIELPILLPNLSKLALSVPGYGANLMCLIKAPMLHDLHLDGIRSDEVWMSYRSERKSQFPQNVYENLRIIASHSPGIRRLAIVGMYLLRETWQWILGCGDSSTGGVPFPLLESVAVRSMRATKDQVENTFTDALLEQYAATGGVVNLRRLAYTSSEPRLSPSTLLKLVDAAIHKDSNEIFRLEIDALETGAPRILLDAFPQTGVEIVVHNSPKLIESWWTFARDIDATEADSY